MVISCTFPAQINRYYRKNSKEDSNILIIKMVISRILMKKFIIISLEKWENPWKQSKIRDFEIGQILYGMNVVTTRRQCGFTENK